MEDCEPMFESQDEALKFYRNLAFQYKKRFRDSQKDLEEFQEGSRDLETELEAQLQQAETKNKELSNSNLKLQQECERLQEKLAQRDKECGVLQDEVQQLQVDKEDLRLYVRKLEQKNDDFERATRASLMSLEDFETRLNQAIERNAFLENELDEKENMAVLIQRLKDEARDLKQELTLSDAVKPTDVPLAKIISASASVDVQRRYKEPQDSFNRPPSRRSSSQFISNAASLVPHSAMNILGDLLKKVGVLESKLQSCRDCLKDTNDHSSEKQCVTIAIKTSSRVKHMNGTPVSSLQDFIPLTV